MVFVCFDGKVKPVLVRPEMVVAIRSKTSGYEAHAWTAIHMTSKAVFVVKGTPASVLTKLDAVKRGS